MIEVQIVEKRYKDGAYLLNEFNHNRKSIKEIAIENNVAYNTIMNWVLKNRLNGPLKNAQIKRHLGPGPKEVKLKLTDNLKLRIRIMSEVKRSNYVNFGYFH